MCTTVEENCIDDKQVDRTNIDTHACVPGTVVLKKNEQKRDLTGTMTNWYNNVRSIAAATRGAATGTRLFTIVPLHSPMTAGNIVF